MYKFLSLGESPLPWVFSAAQPWWESLPKHSAAVCNSNKIHASNAKTSSFPNKYLCIISVISDWNSVFHLTLFPLSCYKFVHFDEQASCEWMNAQFCKLWSAPPSTLENHIENNHLRLHLHQTHSGVNFASFDRFLMNFWERRRRRQRKNYCWMQILIGP